MRRIIKQVIPILLTIITMILCWTGLMKKLNLVLEYYANAFNLSGIIVAVVVLVIALHSYHISTQKADLFLIYRIYINGSENDFSENGKRSMELITEEKSKGEDVVTTYRPGSEVEMKLDNRGKVAAKNPIIDFQFVNMSFWPLKSNVGWKSIDHNQGHGWKYVGNL